ncbi:MAG: DUF1616 domain-containing protein [Haloferacaceae archaeon]
MTDNPDRSDVESTLREYLPADLAAILLTTMATVAAVAIPGLNATPVRSVLAVPFVLFVPGYALVAALFPRGTGKTSDADGANDDESGRGDRSGISWAERVALAFGTSIAVVPLIGLLLNSTPFGIRLGTVLLSVSGVTLGLTYVATYRRLRLPERERLVVPYREWIRGTARAFSGHESRRDTVLTVVAVVAVLLAASSVGYAFAVPQQADAFTEFYVVTEQEDGDLVADDYPTNFTVGESQPLVVGVGNHEHRSVEYSLVVELQEVTVENNSTTVHGSEELLRRQPTVADGETWHESVDIEPETEGTRLRLTFMLFDGEAPADPTVDDAYRETHLWIDVSGAS